MTFATANMYEGRKVLIVPTKDNKRVIRRMILILAHPDTNTRRRHSCDNNILVLSVIIKDFQNLLYIGILVQIHSDAYIERTAKVVKLRFIYRIS